MAGDRDPGRLQLLREHVDALRQCTACADMIRPVITGTPVVSPVVLLGQAPGNREGDIGQPFAWTAGTTLFKWLASAGIDEPTARARIYIASVCRCFPGKNPKGGDRVPRPDEIASCARWLRAEVTLLRPRLIIPVGKLAIAQVLPVGKLTEVIGTSHRVDYAGHAMDAIPLPHPSGASTWHRTEPGVTLLSRALALLAAHPAFAAVSAPPADQADQAD